jgi:hypothetical protein
MAPHTSTGRGLASKPSAPVLSKPSMGDEPAAALVHEVQVYGDGEVQVYGDGGMHRAECSCGWASDWYADDVVAVVAGAEHSEIAVGRPEALDGFMGELLDIQDDLSELVVWLAEHWSADLPIPALWGLAGTGQVEVSVYCDSRAELARVAERLGVEVVRDRRYDAEKETYWCARRRFGRVALEAWRYGRYGRYGR